MAWSDIKHQCARKWRWLRAGAASRGLMRSQLLNAAIAQDLDAIHALWSNGLNPSPSSPSGCALTLSIQNGGSQSQASALLKTLWPKAFGQGVALRQAFCEPVLNEPFARDLAKRLPRRARDARTAGSLLARGLFHLQQCRPDQASWWLHELTGNHPLLLPGIARRMAVYSAENLLSQTLDLAAKHSQRLATLCERLALEGFASSSYRERQMARLSEGMLRRLVKSATPELAAKARLDGMPCSALTGLIDAKLDGHPSPVNDKTYGRWLVHALRNESFFFRIQPSPDHPLWWLDPELLRRLRTMAQSANPPARLPMDLCR